MRHHREHWPSCTTRQTLSKAACNKRGEVTKTSKGKAIAAVHAAMDSRLFGEGDWLADRESCAAVDRLLHEHGFLSQLSDSSSRCTALGHEANVDLLMCFLGLWDEWEIWQAPLDGKAPLGERAS